MIARGFRTRRSDVYMAPGPPLRFQAADPELRRASAHTVLRIRKGSVFEPMIRTS